MVGQCIVCKQIKNLIAKKMCARCYQLERLKTNKRAVRECKICGTPLRANNYITCRYCRQERAVWERKARVIIEKRIPVLEKERDICLAYMLNNITMEELAKKYNITKGGVSYIVNKGLDYYNNRLAELKQLYGDYSVKIKQYELKVNS